MTTNNQRYVVETKAAPAAIGPYSQAICANGLVFCSGQIPIVPKTGEMLEGDVERQTQRVMENLAAVLDAADSDLSRVVKCTIFLVDLADFQTVNQVYASYFPEDPPARACVEVSALPKGARVEIEAIALQ